MGRNRRGASLLIGLLLAAVVSVYLAPFGWFFIQSFQTNLELTDVPPRLAPAPDPFANYKVLLLQQKPSAKAQEAYEAAVPEAAKLFPRAILNTLLIAGGTTLLSLVLSAGPGYLFARVRFRGRQTLLLATIALRMFPVIIVLVPLFVLASKVELVDNPLGLILVYTGYMIPYAIWVLATYFETIPRDIEDSALIDGCSRLGVIRKIVLPLARPGLVAAGVFVFLVSWNEFAVALILTRSDRSYTIPVVLSMFSQTLQLTPFDLMIAAGVVGALVPAILVMFFQRHIISGLTMGSTR